MFKHAASLLFLSLGFAFCAEPTGELTRFETNAPVTDFTLPMFGANGYKIWDLAGKQGRYQSQEHIEIDELRLRVFSGDEQVRVDVTIESPHALVNAKASQARGEGFLYVQGPGYSVTGKKWYWDDKADLLEINSDVQLTFVSDKPDSPPILISSEKLRIETQEAGYHFVFTGKVRVINDRTEMQSPALQAWSERAAEKSGPDARPSGIRRILADQGVVVLQPGRRLTAQKAELPEASLGREIVLTGKPRMHDIVNDAVLTGGQVQIWRDRQQVIVLPEKIAPARVTASLPPTQKNSGKRMEIVGQRMEMNVNAQGQRELSFFERVAVRDPGINLWSDELTAILEKGQDDAVVVDPTRTGGIERIVAKSNVSIDQDNRRTLSQLAEVFPKESRVVLTGAPTTVTDQQNGTVLEGGTITLYRDENRVTVKGCDQNQSHVIMAPLEQKQSTAVTHIYSDTIEMLRGDGAALVRFFDNVKIEGLLMKLQCERLDVYVSQQRKGEAARPASSSLSDIERIEAHGHVRYEQGDIRSESARADIFPRALVDEDIEPLEQGDGEGAQESTPPAPRRQRFVTLFGDPEGKQGPVRPKVFLPETKTTDLLPPASAQRTYPEGEPSAQYLEGVITSDEQELFCEPGASRFFFRGKVELQSENGFMHCDNMEFISTSVDPLDEKSATASFGKPDTVIAQGNVVLAQGTGRATAERATLLLRTGKYILDGNPIVTDSTDDSKVEGYRIILFRGEKRVIVEPAPATPAGGTAPARQRPKVTLPSFGDMGFDRTGKSADKGK